METETEEATRDRHLSLVALSGSLTAMAMVFGVAEETIPRLATYGMLLLAVLMAGYVVMKRV